MCKMNFKLFGASCVYICVELSYLHALYSSTVASNGGNVIVGLPRGEASHGFEAGEWSNHAGTGTVDGGNSWGGDH